MTWLASATRSASTVVDSRHVVLDTAFGGGEQFLATLARHRAAQAATHSTRHADGATSATVDSVSTATPHDVPGGGDLHYLAIAPAIPALAALTALADAVPALAAQWPLDVPGLHRLHLPQERVTLDLLAGPVEAWLPEIVARIDAFVLPAPLEHIRALQRLAAPAATLRIHQPDETALRKLRAAGFSPAADSDASEGWQHFAYTSRKPQPPRAPAAERRAIVIGAGVAGSAACERLAARGWQVTLIERHSVPAQEASGNHAGIFMPLLSKDDNIPTRLARAGYLYAQRAWQNLGGIGPHAPGPGAAPPAAGDGAVIRGHQCGVLQLARDAEHAQVQKDVVDTWRYPEQYVRWLDAQQASTMLGAPTLYGAWHFPLGGWATPATACRAMLQACGDKLQRIFHSEALRLERSGVEGAEGAEGGEWRVLDADGRVLASAPTVILANGAGATALAQASELPLYTMRGQVTHLHEGEFPSLKLVVCREAYMTPVVDGTICVGATYDQSEDRALWQASQDENLQKAEEILGTPAQAARQAPLRGRVGFRTMAPDRLPLVGALPDSGAAGRTERLRELPRHPGLHTLLGYASRGIIWGPLAAEILACQLEDEPLPIEATLAAALDPGRFLLKQRRKL
ncbi:FAD-dependent 5-carboxymethylaminomethyl-2-thiouridine(34) oxidoreductase MnmC [Massilia sp. SR12]